MEALPVAVVPPVAILLLGLLLIGITRNYPLNRLAPYTKKIIAISIIWVMGVKSAFGCGC